MAVSKRKALILSVGYGQGHHSAAHALAEELGNRGWKTRVADPCALAHPRLFAWTQRFYHFCVRRAPWLWGVTYSQTDTADWSRLVDRPILAACTRKVHALVEEENPDVILCTYPLFAYMLDALREGNLVKVPYAVVVTDALEISRPWMLTKAPLVVLPDEMSRSLVLDRYALDPEKLVALGFPVRQAFVPPPVRRLPSPWDIRIVYGVYAPLSRVREDIRGLLELCPGACMTVLAGERAQRLRDIAMLAPERVSVIEGTNDMPSLFAGSHLYIGKAGAATMFEAYASHLPMIVNYALPGQEQGNLALMLMDGAGLAVGSTSELLLQVSALLRDQAVGWRRLCAAIKAAGRSGAAVRIVNELERRFF